MKIRIGGAFTALDVAGLALPQAEADIDDPALPYLLHIAVTVVHGKPICASLTAEQRAGGVPVTRRGLNALPVDRLTREIAAHVAMRATVGPGTITYDMMGSPGNIAAVRKELAPKRGRRADPAWRGELLGGVTAAYRDLLKAGIRQPKPHIARELGISQAYVGALLTEARRRGLLGPAIPGRAGEADRGPAGAPRGEPDSHDLA